MKNNQALSNPVYAIIEQESDSPPDYEWYGKFHNLMVYSSPRTSEPLWTVSDNGTIDHSYVHIERQISRYLFKIMGLTTAWYKTRIKPKQSLKYSPKPYNQDSDRDVNILIYD